MVSYYSPCSSWHRFGFSAAARKWSLTQCGTYEVHLGTCSVSDNTCKIRCSRKSRSPLHKNHDWHLTLLECICCTGSIFVIVYEWHIDLCFTAATELCRYSEGQGLQIRKPKIHHPMCQDCLVYHHLPLTQRGTKRLRKRKRSPRSSSVRQRKRLQASSIFKRDVL